MGESNYEKLAKINVNDKTEKKGRFTYLSWAWAADQLLRQCPDATWTFGEPLELNDGTMITFCTVTAAGKSMTCQMPVLDHNNKAIKNPNAFDVNTAMMRGLAKCIALHGLGLYIYAGEDLPHDDGDTGAPPKPRLFADYKKDLAKATSADNAASIKAGYRDSAGSWTAEQKTEANLLFESKVAEFENAK